jgi:hypothetical protein
MERRDDAPAAVGMDVRDEDLEPHEGLRYVARLFKVLALLLVLLLAAEIVLGLARNGTEAIPTLLVEATRLIVFGGLLWGAGDMALMLIESNHDLRATRILVGRLNAKVQQLVEGDGAPPAGRAGISGPQHRLPSHQERPDAPPSGGGNAPPGY